MIVKKSRPDFVTEDTIRQPIEHLIEDRLPWLCLGLLGGILTTFIVSHYEALLTADVRLVFFIPLIVYLSDAVGTQTETIYIRSLNSRRINFLRYIFKETLVGLGLGLFFGIILGVLAAFWLHSLILGLTIGLTILINQICAPLLATIIPAFLRKNHTDPALGAGPVATIIQDLLSIIVYFVIASFFIL